MGQRQHKGIDNVQWAREVFVVQCPDVPTTDPDAVLDRVMQIHPYLGCSSLQQPDVAFLDRTLTLQELAKHADAVCVICCDTIGRKHLDTKRRSSDVTLPNTTAVGNVAFIALHHADMHVRNEFTTILDQWRKT